ncbi:ATP-NAD kinase-like domain-containing protein, partial [Piptocephalis cylindrospora]
QEVIDFVITLGGDGTILHASSLFPGPNSPPIISFSLGTLGFLLPFHIRDYQKALASVIQGKASLLPRMRLSCTAHLPDGSPLPGIPKRDHGIQAMNEINLHRGRYPHLTSVLTYLDDVLLTDAIADGLIIATPTGSTAYSLSAGGPIVHPSVQTMLLTPVCPRSLSFRPLLLPVTSHLRLLVSESSRGDEVEVSFDGREICLLPRGAYLQISMSPWPLLCVNRIHGGVDWARDINGLLKWNQNFGNK